MIKKCLIYNCKILQIDTFNFVNYFCYLARYSCIGAYTKIVHPFFTLDFTLLSYENVFWKKKL